MLVDNEEFLSRNTRFVAFMDVLGYRNIVSDDIPDIRKAHRLHSIFENVGGAVLKTLRDDEHDAAVGAVEAVHFSDSYYFSSKDLPRLLSFVERVFANTYLYQSPSYHKDQDNWIPFVRSGIVEGWAVSFRDPTLNKVPQPEVFRNPVGPAVAEAHLLTEKLLTEKQGISGMRCFLKRDLLSRCSSTQVANPPHYKIASGERELRLLDVPAGDVGKTGLNLVELAWPCAVIADGNCSFLNPLAKCKEQFYVGSEEKQGRREQHYNATVDLFERSVAICGDDPAVTAWDRGRGDLTLSASPH